MPTPVDQIKHKLRQLKKLELSIRFPGRSLDAPPKLVWDVFFSTRNYHDLNVKYPLWRLVQMSHQELKAVFDEYFYRVYFQRYGDLGLSEADVYDPQLLTLLGLPSYAGLEEIKQRFRELAKRYHPDLGGDSEKFIELMSVYERLTEAK